MNKVIRDGKVAVLYSPDFGAGWYTWNIAYDEKNDPQSLLFDPILVELVENISGENKFDFVDRIEKRAEELVPNGYFGAADKLKIEWIPVGTQFVIDEYDGSESIRVKGEVPWITA
jgi:hypothetical protein